MIQIAICDDIEEELAGIEELARQFAREHPHIPMELHRFCSSCDLLEYIEKEGGFDVLLLDIIMPGADGIQVGQEVARRGERCEIIYLTISREYGVEAFEVRALDYLLKPIDKEAFDRALLRAFENLTPADNPVIWAKTKDGVRKVWLKDIVYIESLNRQRLMYLVDGSVIKVVRTLYSLFEELAVYDNFYMPHRAYIVNFDYVTGFGNEGLSMYGGTVIPVSRTSGAELRQTYLGYALGGKKAIDMMAQN